MVGSIQGLDRIVSDDFTQSGGAEGATWLDIPTQSAFPRVIREFLPPRRHPDSRPAGL
jgi:hypothetical protein